MITRRKFLRRSLQVSVALGAGASLVTAYGFWEARHIQIKRQTVAVPNLPAPFAGKTLAVLADLHHGPYVSISYIRAAVALANQLQPDMIALVGDYAHKGHRTADDLPPCLEALSQLRAPLGIFAVPGNHDMQNQGQVYRDTIATTTALADITNRHERVSLAGEHLYFAGVDDLWRGKPDLDCALNDIPDAAAVVLLSHNPDYAESRPDARVGLMLSGHTHGGQVYLPMVGSPWIPSRYGKKYCSGLVQGPSSQVFISRGLGEAGVPIRFNVPPEINLLTLVAPS